MLLLAVYKAKQKPRKKSFNHKALLISGLVIAVVGLGSVVSYKLLHKQKTVAETAPSSTSDKINLSPATPAEKSEAEQNKDKIPSNQPSTQPTPSTGSSGSKKSVKPVITNATSDNVSAYVSGIFEDGGSCTATFTKGTSTLSKTTSGFQNVSYTQCAPFDLDSGYLSKGTWTVSVKYSSSTSEGTSDNKTIEVK